MEATTWMSLHNSAISNYMSAQHTEGTSARLIATDVYLRQRTELSTRTKNIIKWKGGTRQIKEGEAFFTYSMLAKFLDCGKKRAKSCLKAVADQMNIIIETSDKKGSAGVVISWENWKHASKPFIAYAEEKKKGFTLEVIDQGDMPKNSSHVLSNLEPERNRRGTGEEPLEHLAGKTLERAIFGEESQGALEGLPSKDIKYKNNNINSLTLPSSDQIISKENLGESEKNLISLYKNLFGKTVKKDHIESFLIQLEENSIEKIEKDLRTIASDPILKASTFSINGVFHLDNRLDDLRKVKSDLESALSEIAKDWDVNSLKLFEEQISMLHPKLLKRVNGKHFRINLNWSEKDFRAYFSKEIDNARHIFESRVGVSNAFSSKAVEDCQVSEVQRLETRESKTEFVFEPVENSKTKISEKPAETLQGIVNPLSEDQSKHELAAPTTLPDSRSSSDILRVACATALAEPKDSQPTKIDDERVKVRESLTKIQSEQDLEELIKELSSEFEIPQELASKEGFLSYFKADIDNVALERNKAARQKFLREQKMRKELIELGASVENLRPLKLTLPFPSFENQENTSAQCAGRAV